MYDKLFSIVEKYDRDTAIHCLNVAKYSVFIARTLGYSDEDISLLETAAKLHDIGKIFIPLNILNKKGKLTDLERKIIEKHSYYGFQFLIDNSVNYQIANLVLYHHEREDGSGYPDGITQIDALTKILAACDVFDAIKSDRPYRKSMSCEQVEDIMKNSCLWQKAVNILLDEFNK